jgi:hypothetical protein
MAEETKGEGIPELINELKKNGNEHFLLSRALQRLILKRPPDDGQGLDSLEEANNLAGDYTQKLLGNDDMGRNGAIGELMTNYNMTGDVLQGAIEEILRDQSSQIPQSLGAVSHVSGASCPIPQQWLDQDGKDILLIDETWVYDFLKDMIENETTDVSCIVNALNEIVRSGSQPPRRLIVHPILLNNRYQNNDVDNKTRDTNMKILSHLLTLNEENQPTTWTKTQINKIIEQIPNDNLVENNDPVEKGDSNKRNILDISKTEMISLPFSNLIIELFINLQIIELTDSGNKVQELMIKKCLETLITVRISNQSESIIKLLDAVHYLLSKKICTKYGLFASFEPITPTLNNTQFDCELNSGFLGSAQIISEFYHDLAGKTELLGVASYIARLAFNQKFINLPRSAEIEGVVSTCILDETVMSEVTWGALGVKLMEMTSSGVCCFKGTDFKTIVTPAHLEPLMARGSNVTGYSIADSGVLDSSGQNPNILTRRGIDSQTYYEVFLSSQVDSGGGKLPEIGNPEYSSKIPEKIKNVKNINIVINLLDTNIRARFEWNVHTKTGTYAIYDLRKRKLIFKIQLDAEKQKISIPQCVGAVNEYVRGLKFGTPAINQEIKKLFTAKYIKNDRVREKEIANFMNYKTNHERILAIEGLFKNIEGITFQQMQTEYSNLCEILSTILYILYEKQLGDMLYYLDVRIINMLMGDGTCSFLGGDYMKILLFLFGKLEGFTDTRIHSGVLSNYAVPGSVVDVITGVKMRESLLCLNLKTNPRFFKRPWVIYATCLRREELVAKLSRCIPDLLKISDEIKKFVDVLPFNEVYDHDSLRVDAIYDAVKTLNPDEVKTFSFETMEIFATSGNTEGSRAISEFLSTIMHIQRFVYVSTGDAVSDYIQFMQEMPAPRYADMNLKFDDIEFSRISIVFGRIQELHNQINAGVFSEDIRNAIGNYLHSDDVYTLDGDDLKGFHEGGNRSKNKLNQKPIKNKRTKRRKVRDGKRRITRKRT